MKSILMAKVWLTCATLLAAAASLAAQEHKAIAAWQASATPTVTSYRVYRDGNRIAATAALSYEDASVAPGTAYTYSVTALDASGAESEPSNMVTVTIPGEPPPPPPPPPQGQCIQTNSNWQSGSFAAQAGTFSFHFTGVPNANGTDSVFGLSASPASAYNGLAVIPQFDPDGTITARNGGSYQAVNRLVYVPGETYRFRGTADVLAKRYDLWVQGPSGPELQIAAQYQFRLQQSSVTQLGFYNTIQEQGSATWCNFALDSEPQPPPAVTISVAPSSVTMLAGGTFQFVATVGNSDNREVAWSASAGSISPGGLYTAPASPGTFFIRAEPAADPVQEAVATVTVTAPAPPPGARTYTFTRTVTGTVDPPPVSVDPPAQTVSKTLRCTVAIPAEGQITEECTEQ